MRPFDGFSPAEPQRRARARSRTVSRPLQRAHLNRNLITEFFFVFSRFEYALKRAGFVRPDRRNAEADWDAFGDSVEQQYAFDEDGELTTSVNYLLSDPPKRQI